MLQEMAKALESVAVQQSAEKKAKSILSRLHEEAIREVGQEKFDRVFPQSTELSEFAPNMEIQAEQIKEVFERMPELEYENWVRMSIDQRVEALNRFEQEIAKIEKRNPITIIHEKTKPGLHGYFDNKNGVIMISDNDLGKNDWKDYRETLDTLFHEGRHAYQHYNLEVSRTEQSSELVNAWRVNLKELGYDKSAVAGFKRYYTQPIEVDARCFAETVIKKLGLQY